ncbi:type VII secretion-associated serine protease mycosin [Streptomyces gamaensis]|uniref:Type VII secretion-associated serine protease mycosin n=1 Tax=Streptomyces gamaensis TaxID=1763542 RepID=A0ABW0ZEQ2_9ACTN
MAKTKAALTLAALLTTVCASVAPAQAAPSGSGECTYPAKPIKGTPWALQRVLLDRLWEHTRGRTADGRPVRVAVIDTGVDVVNPQLTDAVDPKSGADLLSGPSDQLKGPTVDPVGHGTKVAGIVAARPRPGTGFVGLAPESVVIPIRQNDERGTGTSHTLALAIRKAVQDGADVINVSQDTAQPLLPDSDLERAVKEALARDVVVIASAGNDGLDGNVKKTYPAAYEGVLAVAASDRNNERAPFSQPGDFIGVAAPGVEMVSTVPGGGQCVDNGTSFSAPYVAGVAALLRAKHPDWKQHQIVAQIEQTAERTSEDRDRYVGWGVVDPVRALAEDSRPVDAVHPQRPPAREARTPTVPGLAAGESRQEREERIATYAVGGAGVLVAVIAGVGVVARDRRERVRARGPVS